uniref:Phospholipase A-2-activating protein n=1 Tax=Lygus hesperus TaxID=30085 RepID=A0A146MDH4_LYGHE
MSYKLSYSLPKHDGDVRALKLTADGQLISGSRDGTARIWKHNGVQFEHKATLTGHTHYVTSVEFLPTSPTYPNGLIATGSNDKRICLYTPDVCEPLVALEGHSGTISSLFGVSNELLISSSWDGSCKLWNICAFKCTNTYDVGTKEQPPWAAIYLNSGVLVVGSAEKVIKVYQLDTGLESRVLKGHTDCVRGLEVVDDQHFLSCSNDGIIMKWNAVTGEKIQTFPGHPNFIYNISLNAGILASAGEDGCALVWKGNKAETILHPAQSVWSVAVLPNGDVATGSSDGVVRIFTADDARKATHEELTHYSECVTRVLTKPPGRLAEDDERNVPGPEALAVPGKSHEEIKMIKEDGAVNCYQWNAPEQQWVKIGEVMGAANPGGKSTELEKAYDYVFPVDIEDGKPPLKLYYNKGQDPYVVAQAFIHSHNLPQDYLEQVANHIINSVKGQEPPILNSAYQDPFTGGSRYVPAGFASAPDPDATKLFPISSYVLMEVADLTKIKSKLDETLQTLGTPESSCEEMLDDLVSLGKADTVPSQESITKLKDMLCWPANMIFPVLDLTRLAVRIKQVNKELCCGDPGERLIAMLRSHLVEDNAVNIMMSIRIMANMVVHEHGEELMLSNAHVVYDLINSIFTRGKPKGLQIAVSTLILNMAVLFSNKNDSQGVRTTMVLAENLLPSVSDSQATVRLLVALGTCYSSVKGILSPDTQETLKKLASAGDDQVSKCSRQILDELQKS